MQEQAVGLGAMAHAELAVTSGPAVQCWKGETLCSAPTFGSARRSRTSGAVDRNRRELRLD